MGGGKHKRAHNFGKNHSNRCARFHRGNVQIKGKDLSEGVPHEVFGPWVRWEGGQVIPDLSQRRRRTVVVGPQKIDIGTGGPLTPKKIIKSYDFWTLVKPKLKLTPVSESAGKIQSHGGSGRPSC